MVDKIPGPAYGYEDIIGYDTQGRPVYGKPTPIQVSPGVTYDLGSGVVTIGETEGAGGIIIPPKPSSREKFIPGKWGGSYATNPARLAELESMRKSAEAEAERLASMEQPSKEELAEIGAEAKTQRWEWVGGKSVLSEPYSVLTKYPGESEASFAFRSGQVGGAMFAQAPEFFEKPPKEKKEITAQELFIGPQKDFTKEEIAFEREMRYTSEPGFFASGAEWVKTKTTLPDMWKDLSGVFRKPKVTPEQEAFGFTFQPGPTRGGSMITAPITDKDLSEPALLYRQTFKEELPFQMKMETEITGKREEILADISPGGITPAEAARANKELAEFSKGKFEEYKLGFGTRGEARETARFKEQHPWEFKAIKGFEKMGWKEMKLDTGKLQSKAFQSLDMGGGFSGALAGSFAKTFTGAASFGVGALEGLRTKPIKTIGTTAIIAGVSFATAGLGTVPAVAAYGTTIAKVAKPLQVGLLGVYGVSAGARVLGTPGYYEKFGKAGEIFSTELAPMYLGYKTGMKLAQYKPSVRGDVPPEFAQEKLAYEKAFRDIKGSKIKINKVDWSRVQEVPTKAGPIIEKWAIRHKLVLGGTTAIETGGVKLVRAPRDVEFFTGLSKAKKTGLIKELSMDLRAGGIDSKAIGNAIKFKGIEGHGVNIQDIGALNLERYRYKIYLGPGGLRVADPVSTAYNKVFDLLKTAKVGSPKAVQMKLEAPEAYAKALYKGKVFVRYPKDVTGLLSTAKDITAKSLARYSDFSKLQIPGVQEYKMLRFGRAQELLKPYLGKLATKEAKLVPNYFTGKQAGYLSSAKNVKSYTFHLQKSLFASKKGALGGIPKISIEPSSKYYYLPSTTKALQPYYPIKLSKDAYSLGVTPYKTSYKSIAYKPTTYLPKTTYKPTEYISEKQYKPSSYLPKYKSSYKPTKYPPQIMITPVPFGGEPPTLTPTKKKSFFFGDVKGAPTKKYQIKIERKLIRTPSWGAITKSEYGLKQTKVSTALERTGLSERFYEKPMLIKPLGPFKIKA